MVIKTPVVGRIPHVFHVDQGLQITKTHRVLVTNAVLDSTQTRKQMLSVIHVIQGHIPKTNQTQYVLFVKKIRFLIHFLVHAWNALQVKSKTLLVNVKNAWLGHILILQGLSVSPFRLVSKHLRQILLAV